MNERLIIGAMSGTSADGVDAALVRVGGRGLSMTARLQGITHRPYDAALAKKIFALRASGSGTLADLAAITREITLAYTTAVRELLQHANLTPADVVAVAAHGQTLFHDPPLTMQILDPSLLAYETGCAVVSDFRRADCAAGGQGAPLVPFADYLLFRDATHDRVLLNLGGIANLTYLRAGGKIDEVIAFDTGPGNCISDWICRQRNPTGGGCDIGGVGALRGRQVTQVAERFMSNPYFANSPPKSTDGPAMIAAFTDAIGDGTFATDDLLATAATLTAATVASAILTLRTPASAPLELIASGGGVHNQAIMGFIQTLLPQGTQRREIADFGISAEAKEAVAFALLGLATLDGVPANVPSATGASRAVVLGSITAKP